MRAAVVVPTKNRPGQLKSCLDALSRQDHDDFEVIVVDNGGAVDLEPALRGFKGALSCVQEAEPGPAAARNAGVLSTDCEVVAFTDDDCRPDAAWLRRLTEAVEQSPTALVGGKTENALPDNIYSEASQTLVEFLYEYYGASGGTMPYFTSNNLACARESCLSVGGFDQSFPIAAAEARDLGMRWRESGRDLIYVADAKVQHAHELTFSRFWRQHRNYGRGARHLHCVLDQRGITAPAFEGADFYLRLLSYPLTHTRRAALRQAALLFLSQFATALGYYGTPPLGALPESVRRAQETKQ